MVVLDTSKMGLLALQKDWQVELFTEILADSKKGWSTRDAWNFIKANTAFSKTGQTISRASVFYYLMHLEAEKILINREITGKGGHRAIYYAAMDWNGYGKYVIDVVYVKLHTIFPDNPELKEIARGNHVVRFIKKGQNTKGE